MGKNKSHWHLADDNQEMLFLTEFEFNLWRTFYEFAAWQEQCDKYVNNYDFSAYEIAVLHIVKLDDRSKSITDICTLLNRHDGAAVQYSLNKLMDKGLVLGKKDPNSKRTKLYSVTESGNEAITEYTAARTRVITESLKCGGISKEELDSAKNTLLKLRLVYSEAARLVALPYLRHTDKVNKDE